MFLVFEGMNGSGKTTQMMEVAKYYFDKRKDVLLTKEPSNSPIGKQIREICLKQKDPMSYSEELLELFVKDRRWHLENVVIPALSRGIVVLCDRYYFSNIAYQATQGIDMKKIIEANKEFIKPDKTFLFDLPAELAFKRVESRGREKRKFERLQFMKRLRKNYLKLKSILKEPIVLIDASRTVEEIFEDLKKELPM